MNMVELIEEYSWITGSHFSIEDSLYKTCFKAINLGFNCFQFFLGNPYSLNRKKLTQKDIDDTVRLCKDYNLAIYSHSPYIHNLCGKSTGNPKSDNPLPDSVYKNITSLEYELSILANFPGGGVVIHPGSYKDKEKGIQTIITSLNTINFPENSLLLLENCAGEGNKIPKTLENISAILQGIKSEKKRNVGICMDTAHIHGQGDYNFSIVSEVDRFFHDFDSIIGLSNLRLLHLNDSQVEFGSKKDRHASLGLGTIWGNDIDPLIKLLEYCKRYNIPTVLETPEIHVPILRNIDNQIKLMMN